MLGSADCGEYNLYDNSFDRVVVQKPAVLPSFEKVDLPHAISAEQDPFMEGMAANNAANVYTTDVALAHLMVATRSQLSW